MTYQSPDFCDVVPDGVGVLDVDADFAFADSVFPDVSVAASFLVSDLLSEPALLSDCPLFP